MNEDKFFLLKNKILDNKKNIINKLINNHNSSICIICGEHRKITQEHVLPEWVFGGFRKDPNKYFITTANEMSLAYSRSVVPACQECNNDILNNVFEIPIQSIIKKDADYFTNQDFDRIILWLEFIDYKFQVLGLRRHFKKKKSGDYIPFLEKIPVIFIQKIELSPREIFSILRKSLSKLAIKRKSRKRNSLVVFKTTNKSFHFFHSTDRFIFIELASYGVAFFYFFNEIFDSPVAAKDAAMIKIKSFY